MDTPGAKQMTWELECNGIRKPFEAWSIQAPVRTLVSLDVDTFSFRTPLEFDAPDPFPPGSIVRVFRNGVQWFLGRVDQTPRSASGKYETAAYVVAGPWWFLKQLVYQMPWRTLKDLTNPDAGYVEVLKSHLILNLTTTGALASTKDQIRSVLEYCINAGAPFQIGTIDLPEAYPMTDEVQNLVCEEVIHRQLRWTPDATSFFDYTTDPPTLNILQRSARTPVMLRFGDPEDGIVQIDARPRYDLQIDEVVIKYETVNVVNGVGYPQVVEDRAPASATGKSFNGLVMTFNLEGAQVSYSFSEIVCEEIRANDADWWAGEFAPLKDASITGLTIRDVKRTTDLPRRLRSGTITEWMLSRNRAMAVRETLTAKGSWQVADGDQSIHAKVDNPISTTLIATDLSSGKYLSSLSVTLGETPPTGLASFLYKARSHLHWDGQITLFAEEPRSSIGPQHLLNIAGARPEFEAMNADVQTVIESIEDGRTIITIGPPKHLGPDDIIEFLRAGRNRQRVTPADAMTGGQSFSAAPIDLGKETPVQNSAATDAKFDKFTVATKCIIDGADNPNNREIRLRELPFCDDSSGTPRQRKIMVWCSEIYD